MLLSGKVLCPCPKLLSSYNYYMCQLNVIGVYIIMCVTMEDTKILQKIFNKSCDKKWDIPPQIDSSRVLCMCHAPRETGQQPLRYSYTATLLSSLSLPRSIDTVWLGSQTGRYVRDDFHSIGGRRNQGGLEPPCKKTRGAKPPCLVEHKLT